MAGNLITGNAMPLYCQRDYCQQLLNADGDYPAIVKRNRRELYAAIALAFTTATAAPDGSYRQAQTRQRRGGAAVGKRRGCVPPMRSTGIWTGRSGAGVSD